MLNVKKAPAISQCRKAQGASRSGGREPGLARSSSELGTALLKAGMAHQSGGGASSSRRVETGFPGGLEQSRWRSLLPLGLRRMRRSQSQGFGTATPISFRPITTWGLGISTRVTPRRWWPASVVFSRSSRKTPAGTTTWRWDCTRTAKSMRLRRALGRAVALGHTPEPEFLKALESQGEVRAGSGPRADGS